MMSLSRCDGVISGILFHISSGLCLDAVPCNEAPLFKPTLNIACMDTPAHPLCYQMSLTVHDVNIFRLGPMDTEVKQRKVAAVGRKRTARPTENTCPEEVATCLS
jgi:hypothetical protein